MFAVSLCAETGIASPGRAGRVSQCVVRSRCWRPTKPKEMTTGRMHVETVMSKLTHETVPTRFVETEGIRFGYRRFGKAGTVPLLFLEYFNSNMDGWDPSVTNSLARDHEVILFDNAGVAASGGETPDTVAEMTRHCVAFCRGLGLISIHIVGFSLGGMIAQ